MPSAYEVRSSAPLVYALGAYSALSAYCVPENLLLATRPSTAAAREERKLQLFLFRNAARADANRRPHPSPKEGERVGHPPQRSRRWHGPAGLGYYRFIVGRLQCSGAVS